MSQPLLSSELRIGNWVADPLGEYMKVHTLGDNGFIGARCENGFGQNGFYGIDLSPSLLEKCGFSKEPLEEIYFNTEMGFIEEGLMGYILPDADGNNSLHYEITSLHQLQNVFFALTGKELEIKL